MIEIEFTKEIPAEKVVFGYIAYDGGDDASLPAVAVEAMHSKPHQGAVECFTAEGRYVISRLKGPPESSRQQCEEAGAALFHQAATGQETTLLLDLRTGSEGALDVLAGILLSSWRFDRYRTVIKPAERCSIARCAVLCQDPHLLKRAFSERRAAIEGVFLARALTSEPPNVLFPTAYADRLYELEKYGIAVEILAEEQLKTLGMTALLAVGQGSQHASAVAILHWRGATEKKTPPIAIVGKGVCFDAGGVCLKSTAQQQDMKWDKSGAGVVAGVMKALALAKASENVVGILGLVENMPDGAAFKPGDILRTQAGLNVEIVDTDAEGRLVIADCLWYAQERFNPRALIDLGTLTVETYITLGTAYAGLYCNDATLAAALKAAGERSGDRLWELPMGPSFAQQLASHVADIKNSGTDFCGENGAAAEFLRRFVREGMPWAHIDIAGVSWIKEDTPLCRRGVTGFGVRLLTEWLKETS